MVNFFKVSTKKSIKIPEEQNITVTIQRQDLNGCGVAYIKNKPVFVEGALPNENVEIKIVVQKNKYSLAKLITIIKENQHRVVAKCQHFMVCGGCDLQHLDYNQQLQFKQNNVIALFSRSGIKEHIISDLPWQNPIVSSPWGYRRKARIGVQFDKNAQGIIGFRQKSTNQLTSIKSCPVLVDPAAHIFPVLKALINQLSVKKSIGHIEVISSELTDNTQLLNSRQPINTNKSLPKLTLIVRQIRTINDHDRQLWQTYSEQNNWQVYFQSNDTKNQDQPTQLSDNVANNLFYTLGNGLDINFSNSDFIQINSNVNIAMIEQALDWLTPQQEDKILDLFCGLGNFSLPLAQKVSCVVGVEGVQTMVNKATANAKLNQLDNCQFFQADLNSDWLSNEWAKNTFTKVVLDPARAGAQYAMAQIVKLNIATILYVSCDASTLARDSQTLLLNGYKITKIGIIDMFSQTKHVETMVIFRRPKTRQDKK